MSLFMFDVNTKSKFQVINIGYRIQIVLGICIVKLKLIKSFERRKKKSNYA